MCVVGERGFWTKKKKGLRNANQTESLMTQKYFEKYMGLYLDFYHKLKKEEENLVSNTNASMQKQKL